MSDLTPRFIEWQGPEGFTVRLDEDGVMLRAPKGGLEEPDLNRLLDIIAEAKRARDAQSSPTPRPPTRDQLCYYPGGLRRQPRQACRSGRDRRRVRYHRPAVLRGPTDV